jgi:hypothetical protein
MFSPNQKFFWDEARVLLRAAKEILQRVGRLEKPAQAAFFKGEFDSKLLDGFAARDGQIRFEHFIGDVTKYYNGISAQAPQRIVEFCKIRRSQDDAFDRLTEKATDTPNGITGEQWAVRHASVFRTVNRWPIPKIVSEAAEKNDVDFFKRLGRALASKQKDEIDWQHRVDKLEQFLVSEWCGDESDPPWCLFTDSALATFAALRLNRAPISLDAIRKMRQRLKLTQCSNPRITSVKLEDRGKHVLLQ